MSVATESHPIANPTSPPGVWPTDFESTDHDRLWIRRDYRSVLTARGWTSLDAIMNSTDAQVMRQVAERDNCWLSLPSPTGGTVRAFLKRHRNRSFLEWAKEQLRFVADSTPGMAEAKAVGWCQKAGVPTMSVLAAGSGHQGQPWRADSFFLSLEIEGEQLDHFWTKRIGTPDKPLADASTRRAVLTAVADVARRFHQAGLVHRDFYWCHFFVHKTSGKNGIPDVRCALIDLQRVSRPTLLRLWWRIKDLGQFLFSTPPGALTRQEEEAWFLTYLGRDHWNLWGRCIYGLARWRAWLYRRKEGRR